MKKRPITIKDLARKLNISTSTVSRAMRDKPDVNLATKKAVHDLAREWDYEPNSIALSLVNKRTYSVGVIIPNFIIHFYSSAIAGIQKHLSKAGYNVIVCQSEEDAITEINNVHTLLGSRVDGIIMSLSQNTKSFNHIHSIQRKGIPVVLFNHITDVIDSSKVLVDDYSGAKEAVQHLIDEGFTKIAHISGPKDLIVSKNRTKGYKDSLRENGFEVNNDHIQECDFTIEGGIESAKRLMSLADKPDALFCVCDAAAFGAISYLKEQQVRIPEDVGVVGYTDEPLSAVFEPPLTTIAQPTYDIGVMAAQLFLDQINVTVEERVNETVILDTHLAVRKSSLKKSLKSELISL